MKKEYCPNCNNELNMGEKKVVCPRCKWSVTAEAYKDFQALRKKLYGI